MADKRTVVVQRHSQRSGHALNTRVRKTGLGTRRTGSTSDMYPGGNTGVAINPRARRWICLTATILLLCGPRNAGTPRPAGAREKSPPKGSVIVPAGETFTLTEDLE